MLKKDCMYFSFPQKCLLLEHQLIFSLLQSSRNFGDPPKKKHKIKKTGLNVLFHCQQTSKDYLVLQINFRL